MCARVAAFLLYPACEQLNREFAQFTWENAIELIRNEKQRNRENFNFKSAASLPRKFSTALPTNGRYPLGEGILY
jgi:hypothetical protein